MKKGILITSAIVMSVILVCSITLLLISQDPIKKAEKETIAIAKESAGLVKATDFYWYNRDKTYFSVSGVNESDEEIMVIVAKDGGATTVLNQDEFITEQQAKALTREDKGAVDILEARIGLDGETPIWEISYKQENGRLGYYVLTAKSGKWVSDIENI
ncbi:MAG: DUF5590 domain-containing protein [Carnobacterium sp.]|uniref:Uncharacterized protein YpmB n=2 Tax=Carnobacterium viridans TaxID=174587 RepID=A0A1H0XVF6_9LACT|nr:DUF5590 domain-containing protein [Carnobacterium viridans]UDE95500.1 DUF5590 domain-containing protein [Carnobacterium viridans]SDQ06897.1 Uncharacterized protein YpmB [Carnobacterium viridans]